jgi:hypothetical protein
MAAGFDFGKTELALGGAFHLAAQLLRHGLHAVADAEHRHAQLENRCGARGLPASVVDSGPPRG